MLDARIVINVNDQTHSHHNGISGNWIVPGKKPGEEFGILVVHSARELQDVGNNIRTEHWPSSTSVAMDVLEMNSDAAAHSPGAPKGAMKWGLLICEAQPDIPRALLEAINTEREYLNEHRPEIKQRRDQKTRMMLATSVDEPGVAEEKAKLAAAVVKEREKFTAYCRTLVTKAEIATAKKNLQIEDQRLIAEGENMWAGNDYAKRQISELHKRACERLNQERDWCHQSKQLVECPGCGKNIQENILACPYCHGWLDEGIEKLRVMPPKQRKQKMYPEVLEAANS